MRNRYVGICYRCGGEVKPGAGHFEKVGPGQSKKWGVGFMARFLVQHASCAIQWHGTDRHWMLNPIESPLFHDTERGASGFGSSGR